MYINKYALDLSFKDKTEIETDLGKAILNKVDIGKLNVKSGNIIATDPILLYDDQPFSKKIKPSEYNVQLFVAKYENGDERTAMSKLEITTKEPVKWELALYEGESASRLKGDEYMGFEVENGIGCYMDETVMEVLDTYFDDDLEEYENNLRTKVKFSKKSVTFANIQIKGVGSNIIAFTTGWKDGTYPSYYGYDKDNKLCCIVTDYMVLE